MKDNYEIRNYDLYNKNEQFPNTVIIETTDYCNLKCSCCGHEKMIRSKGVMSLELYKKIIKEVSEEAPETNIWMVFYGEPLTLRYKIVYLIDYAKENGLKNVFMNTNGILLDKELSEAILDSKLDKVVFSLDAYYEDTYRKIRRNNDFEKVKQNILDFAEIKRKLGARTKIEVQLIEIPNVHRIDEKEKFKLYWNKNGIETKIKPCLTWTGAVKMHDNDGENRKRIPCAWLFNTFVITWDGNVVQCGCDYDGKYIAGNIKSNNIKRIWQGNLKKIRSLHLEGKFNETPICEKCDDWKSFEKIDFLEES